MAHTPITTIEEALALPVPAPKKDLWVRVNSVFGYKGLFVRVHTTSGGSTSYSFYYRYQFTINGKTTQRKLFIGGVRHMPMFEAQQHHAGFFEEVARGRDPVQDFRNEREAEMSKPETICFKVVCNRWLKEYAAVNLTARSYRQISSTVSKHLTRLGTMHVTNLTARHIVELQDSVYDVAPPTSNKVLSLIKQILSWAVSKSYVEINVALPLKARHKSKPRTVHFTDQNVHDILNNLPLMWVKENGYRIVRLLFATGCRRSEIVELRVDECISDPSTGKMIIQIDGSRIKTGVTHTIFLLPEFADLVRAAIADKRYDDNEYVFESPRWRLKSLCANHVSHEFKALIRHLEFDERLVMHSIRHTYSTMGVELGMSGALVDETLNHVIGGVRGVYQHGKNTASHKPVFEAIQRRLLEIEGGDIRVKEDNIRKLFAA